MVRAVDLGEPAGGARKKNEPGIGLKRMSQTPSRLRVRHVTEQHVEILDHQHQPLVLPIREILQNAQAPAGKNSVVANHAQVPHRAIQIGTVRGTGHLNRQPGEAFQPELARWWRPGSSLPRTLLETSRTAGRGSCAPRPATRRSRLGFPAAARTNDYPVRVRVSRALAQHRDEGLELIRPHTERRHQFVISQEPGVVLLGSCDHAHATSFGPDGRQWGQSGGRGEHATSLPAVLTRIGSRCLHSPDTRRAGACGARPRSGPNLSRHSGNCGPGPENTRGTDRWHDSTTDPRSRRLRSAFPGQRDIPPTPKTILSRVS